MFNLRNRSTQRLLTSDSARPQASVPAVGVLRLALVLTTGPVMKYPTVGCIEIDLAHLCGQVEFLSITIAHLLDAWSDFLAATFINLLEMVVFECSRHDDITAYRHDV